MTRSDAKEIAKTISNQQIKEMFDSAKTGITDWRKVSSVNKGLTKGVAWNILAKDFDINKNHHILAKTNMVHEFGDYLPDSLKIKRQKTIYSKPPVHHDPQF